jgi:hypothetical protein
LDDRQLKQRLKLYLKRHARHVQIQLANDRAGRVTNQRTLDAIDNNARWIEHYETLLKEVDFETSMILAEVA